MQEVADSLERALHAGKRLLIFGDYDVDGITASAIMFNVLQALGATPQVVLPLRGSEGYGLTEAALQRIVAARPEVVLTVDCGISAFDEIAALTDRGIEVLVTDHHEISSTCALTVPAADPKLDSNCPAQILCGAGVALKLAAVIGSRFGQPDLWKSQLDLAALGTIADCMSLIGENRSLVLAGVKTIINHPRPGIAAVQQQSGRSDRPISSEELAFGLIPRLNAAGRVSDPLIAFDLLCCREPEEALRLALKLESLNGERKQLETLLMAQAARQIEPFDKSRKSLVVGGQRWHEGVRGIVASRLADRYGVPTLVFSLESGLAVGSGRSVGTLNLHEAVNGLSDLLVRFGGHEAAIGVTIDEQDLQDFSQRFEAVMQDTAPELFTQLDAIDCQISFDHLSLESIEELSILEPFGRENPEPRFMTCGLLLKSPRYVGADKQHLSLVLSDGARELQAIWFNAPYSEGEDLPAMADVIYRVQVDEWRGRRTIKLMVLDILTQQTDGLSHQPSADNSQRESLTHLLLLGSQRAADEQIANLMNGSEVKLRAAQLKCLENLEQKRSTLAIMATGRGKSLIFHTHAAKLALQQGKPSLFIYPLRSLISDQEYFLTRSLAALGLSCASLTGSTPPEERERIALGVKDGTVQVVLSTPEFIVANAQRLEIWEEFGFVVVDEAHHIATSSESFRPDYTCLEQVRALTGGAVILGVSATSDKPTTDLIVADLAIESIVVDTSKRLNLQLSDKRNAANRGEELVNIVQASSRALVYTSTRSASIDLCRTLRKELPHKAQRIAFYNAALTAEDRYRVEESFRAGELDCLVATSAFGEGVNIPDVRDVALYDLPYSIIDFSQMAGRVGRDGQEATVHILAHQSDSEQMLLHLAGDKERDEDKTLRSEQQTSIRQLELFTDWLFQTSPHGLLSVIQRPLTPMEE
jgi:single-stranded-DNA-specific exonuclease